MAALRCVLVLLMAVASLGHSSTGLKTSTKSAMKGHDKRRSGKTHPQRPYVISEAGFGSSLQEKHKTKLGEKLSFTDHKSRSIEDIRRLVSGHEVQDVVLLVDGKKLEKIIDGGFVYIAYDGKVIHESVIPDISVNYLDRLTSVQRDGYILIIYNQKVIYEGHPSSRYEHVRTALFYSAAALLGLAIVLVLGKSITQACRARKVVRKIDDSVNYAVLVEDELVADDASEYKCDSAHCVSAPELV